MIRYRIIFLSIIWKMCRYKVANVSDSASAIEKEEIAPTSLAFWMGKTRR